MLHDKSFESNHPCEAKPLKLKKMLICDYIDLIWITVIYTQLWNRVASSHPILFYGVGKYNSSLLIGSRSQDQLVGTTLQDKSIKRISFSEKAKIGQIQGIKC